MPKRAWNKSDGEGAYPTSYNNPPMPRGTAECATHCQSAWSLSWKPALKLPGPPPYWGLMGMPLADHPILNPWYAATQAGTGEVQVTTEAGFDREISTLSKTASLVERWRGGWI